MPPIVVNGTTIEKIIIGGTEIEKVVVGNTVVFQKITKLATPDITLDGDYIEWDAINGAEGYDIYVDYSYVDYTTSTYYNLSSLNLESGTYYTVYIYAYGTGYETSDRSNSVYYEPEAPLEELGSATIDFVWYESTAQLVCSSRSFSGVVADCSVSVDDRWTVLPGELFSLEIEFYDFYDNYIGSETLELNFIEGDGTMYPSLSYTYYG